MLTLLFAGLAVAAPRIELYTMGPGDDLFSAFGHAAICVLDESEPRGRCYNYGTADFRTPLPLTWNFVRGRARFWVSVMDLPSMVGFYVEDDRTLYRQTLALAPGQARALAGALEASTDERVKYYRYHHFDDNCTTRIRDHLDRATGGALRRDPGATVDGGRSFRELAREGFAGHWPLLAVVELFLGRAADRRTDSWTAMFLPSALRAEVARKLGAEPEVIYARRRQVEHGSIWLGRIAFALGGALLALAVAAGARLRGAGWRAGLAATGVVLGLLGATLTALAFLSSFRELSRNEMAAVFWPTDLFLGVLPARWLRPYLGLRAAALGLVVAGHLAGLSQPLWPVLLAALPIATALAVRPRGAQPL